MVENTEVSLTTDAVLVNAIVDVLTTEAEGIQQLLDRKNLLESN